MAATTRTFRVFVSSTFEDLKEERNALQREVFPKLSELCASRGARFQAIDLRWGVRDEAALDQKTLEICLAEIERCQNTKIKPNFIVLLGSRYGWRPPPARIKADEFETVCRHVADRKEQALIENWYELDKNAEPPEYLLKPRTGPFIDKSVWAEVENALHGPLRTAARTAGLSADDLIKYEGSATHQEILKGLGETAEDRKHVFAFLRLSEPDEEESGLRALKTFLRQHLGKNVVEFIPGDLAGLCDNVEAALGKVILSEISHLESRPALDVEIEAHDKFAKDRSEHFVGRKAVLDAITEYLQGQDRRPLVIHGDSGSGKSAIMAKASEQASAAVGGAAVIRRFIGVTPESSNGLTLLRDLYEQIRRRYEKVENVPATFNELATAFSSCIRSAIPERPLVLFLDAVDQLGQHDRAVSMNWLPTELPANCKVVLSTIVVPPTLRRARLFQVGDFPEQEADKALKMWLEDEHRTLQPEQCERVMASFGRCPRPLYLKLAFEEARRWHSFDMPERHTLGEGLEGIVDGLIDRLSEESNHGSVMVTRALGYLATARYGLTEEEILSVLSQDDEVWRDFTGRARHETPERHLPVIVWSRLYLDLEPYLTNRTVHGDTVVTFYHKELPERIGKRFLVGDDGDRTHKMLTRLFDRQPLWLDRPHDVTSERKVGGNSFQLIDANQFSLTRRVPNRRKLLELPFQQTRAAVYPELERTLSDLSFLEAKCLAGLQYDLLEDCDRALSMGQIFAIANVREALISALPSVNARPVHSLQALYNRLIWTKNVPPALREQLAGAHRLLDQRGPWIRSNGRFTRQLADSAVSYPLAIQSAVQSVSLPAQAFAVADFDGDLVVHRLTTGEMIWGKKTEARQIAGIVLSADGHSVAFLERSGRIRVDRAYGVLPGRPGERTLIYDGHEIVAVRDDDALVAWHPERDECIVLAKRVPKPLVVLRRSTADSVLCVAGYTAQRLGVVAADANGQTCYRSVSYAGKPILDADLDEEGTLVLAACLDRRLTILDAVSGKELAALAYEQVEETRLRGVVEHCAFGRGELEGRAVFATAEGQVASWDWKDGRVDLIDDQTESSSPMIVILRCLDSGRVLVSSPDHVSLLDPRSHALSIKSHARAVTTVGITQGGKVVSFSQGDRSVVWHSTNPVAPQHLRTLKEATAMTVLPGTEDVIVADRTGRIWKELPQSISTLQNPIKPFSLEAVIALCPAGEGLVAAATPSGTILLADTGNGDSEIIRYGTGGFRQRDIMKAGRFGVCWSNHLVNGPLSLEPVLSLLSSSGRDRCVLRVDARAASTCDDGATVCFTDSHGVHIVRHRWRWFLSHLSKQVPACQVAFLGDTSLLAVARLDDHWLEIWRVESGLPVVAAIELPDEPTCMAANEEQIALGFSTGETMSLRPMKIVREM